MTIIFKSKDIEEAYYRGCKDKEEDILKMIEYEQDKIIMENFSPEQLLAITYLYVRIKQSLKELGEKQ
jgi:hypothetical protein